MKTISILARFVAPPLALVVFVLAARAQQPPPPPPGADLVEIFADQQRKVGTTYLAEGNVHIRYRGLSLEAARVIYDEQSAEVEAHGNVVFAREDDRLEASDAFYNLETGRGEFHNVKGTVGVPPEPSNDFLVTTNPYYFEGERVDRHTDGSYLVRNGWVTNCQPGNPKWRLKTAQAKIRPGQNVVLRRSTFLLGGVPILYSPIAAISLAKKPRQSGFLAPSFGNDSRKGTNLGTSFFWAINPHADLTAGARFFNLGGCTQTATFRARPSVNSTVTVNYFGAIATKIRRGQAEPVEVDGHFADILASTRFGSGFRGVLDISFLSSFRFRQAFAETFDEVVRTEVRADAFVSNNTGTFYFNGFISRFQDFFQALPERSVTILALPGLEFGTRPHWLDWLKEQPVYFTFTSSAAGMRRDEPRFQTPEVVQRFTIYPRVTIPFRLGRYFGLTPTFGVRATRYGSRLVDDPADPERRRVVNDSLRRITQEVTVELDFPSFQKIFDSGHNKYKHVIEPEVTYRYVNGVRRFDEIIRFDEHDILTDTHEVEYGIVQRFFAKQSPEGHAEEVLTWRLSQKYFFNPDFGGALQPGQRNVFASLISVTPFAFADKSRRFSPIISVLKFAPQRRYNLDFRLDYDPEKSLLANSRIRGTMRLTELVNVSLGHFTTRNNDLLQAELNQMTARVAYGRLFRPGFNAAFAFRWDFDRDFLPNQTAQVSYNWDCCGVAFSFRRLGVSPLRSENEFRFSFTIANTGTFGTLEERQRIF